MTKAISWFHLRVGRAQPKTATIYALRDPTTGAIRYIGKTHIEVYKRVSGHLAEARKGNGTAKARWLRSLLEMGQRPDVVVLGRVRFSDWPEWERKCIQWATDAGCDLLNERTGGGGP